MTASPNESSPTAAGTLPEANDAGASGSSNQLERYDVRSRLAVGGMAEVYLATARGAHGFEKTVALKRILPQLALDSQFERRFIGEAKLAAKLSHANIVQVLDFGRYGGSWYIAMEFVDGVDLAHLLREVQAGRQQLPLTAAFHIAIELLRGLEYAHQLGVVHRDVSPSNILLSRAGEVKIADFGIAIAARRDPLAAQGERVIAGKWRYMSPEQAAGRDVDARSDIFSAGVVLYELFTGQRLFNGSSSEEIAANVRGLAIPKASSLRPDLPAALDDILAGALQREPMSRTARAAIMQRAITELSYQCNIVVSPEEVAGAVATAITSTDSRKSLDQVIRQQLAAVGIEASTQASQASQVGASTLRHTDLASLPGVAGGAEALAAGRESKRDLWQPRQDEAEATSLSLVYHIGRDGIAELEEQVGEAPPVPEATIAGLPRARRPSVDALRLDDHLLETVGAPRAVTAGERDASHSASATAPLLARQALAARGATEAPSATFPRPRGRAWLVALFAILIIASGTWQFARNRRSPDPDSTPTATMSALQVDSEPLGASVSINGVAMGRSPVQWSSFSSDAVRVEVRLEGYEAYVDPAVALRDDATTRVFARLRPLPTAAAVAPDSASSQPATNPTVAVTADARVVRPPVDARVASPRVDAGDDVPVTLVAAKPKMATISLYIDDSWAEVYLRGKLVGRAPSKALELPIGTHTLVLKNPPSGRETTIEVLVEAGRVNYFRTKF
ncbi:MAG: protein kinase [Myxococcales bacterium]|nr:protein kinase [Myxococcales bacterium]